MGVDLSIRRELALMHWPTTLLSHKSGSVGYAIGAIRAFAHAEAFTIDLAARQLNLPAFRTLMVTFANGRVEGGSFQVAPEASISDGKLNVTVLPDLPGYLFPYYLARFATRKGTASKRIITAKKSEYQLTLHALPMLHIDGEQETLESSSVTVTSLPGAIQVLR